MPYWQERAKKVTRAEKATRPSGRGLEFGTLKSHRDIAHDLGAARKRPGATARRDALMGTLTRTNIQTRKKRKATGRKLRRGTRETTTLYGPRTESYGRRASLKKARKTYGGKSYAGR